MLKMIFMFTIMLFPAGTGFMIYAIGGGIRMATLRMLGLMLAVVLATGSDKISGTSATTSGPAGPLTDLPRGITSFGAAVIGDWLYVYGGHFGRPHHYSNTSQSDELSRLNLRRPADWETIAKGPRLQGLAMVAHGGKLYRVGGFTAHNEEDDDHDLRSVADFVRFHPETGKWESLPSLPEPRSSHDAVVIVGQSATDDLLSDLVCKRPRSYRLRRSRHQPPPPRLL